MLLGTTTGVNHDSAQAGIFAKVGIVTKITVDERSHMRSIVDVETLGSQWIHGAIAILNENISAFKQTGYTNCRGVSGIK